MKEASSSEQSTFRHSIPPLETLGDFTTTWRVLPISGLAMGRKFGDAVSCCGTGPDNRLVGMIGLQDLLKARELSVEQELTRERVLRLRVQLSLRKTRSEPSV